MVTRIVLFEKGVFYIFMFFPLTLLLKGKGVEGVKISIYIHPKKL